MAQVNVYLTFNGNCREAFEFYQTVFDTEIPYMGTFGEMPPQEGTEMSEEDKNKIMHVSMPISSETVLMGSDAAGEYAEQVTMGNNFAISVNAESREEAQRIYERLGRQGGHMKMPMTDTFWGAYFGMLTDQFGINWMVNYDDPSKTQQHP